MNNKNCPTVRELFGMLAMFYIAGFIGTAFLTGLFVAIWKFFV